MAITEQLLLLLYRLHSDGFIKIISTAEGTKYALWVLTLPYSAAAILGRLTKLGSTAASWMCRSCCSSTLTAWQSASSLAYASSASAEPCTKEGASA